jgi:hypothetical protein
MEMLSFETKEKSKEIYTVQKIIFLYSKENK